MKAGINEWMWIKLMGFQLAWTGKGEEALLWLRAAKLSIKRDLSLLQRDIGLGTLQQKFLQLMLLGLEHH
jgi:hypothetical protein